MMKQKELITFLEDYLKVKEIADDSLNGLQVEGPEEIERIVTAVDAGISSFQAAVEEGAQLLLVHHGLFWGTSFALTGVYYQRIRLLVENHVGLYACHLPLDMHPAVGNNALLARLLQLEELVPFGEYHGRTIGLAGRLPVARPLPELATFLADQLEGEVQALDFGAQEIRTVALVSGAGGHVMDQGLERFDLLLTGESSHSTYRLAEDAHQSVLFAGHYATETLGIRTLGDLLAERFSLHHTFLDLPSPY
ncbi:MAG: Nif3-like dinuclear metal center hexameric protein [bacterium]